MQAQNQVIDVDVSKSENETTVTHQKNDLAVEIRGLKKYYGSIKAVDGIDLSIKRGTIFGFLGPNGAGKTTTIGYLITLLKPTAGEGQVAGHNLRDTAAIRKKIAAVFQEQTLDEDLTGYQNLRLHAELYGIPKKIREQRIKELARMVGLEERLHDKVIKYSGGMRRRLEIIRALLTEPEILFLDEPTIGLDPQSRANIWEKIKALKEDKGITIFITTHQMDEAEALCDEIAIIDRGKIVISGTPEELKSSLGQDLIILELEDKSMTGAAVKRINSIDLVDNVKVVENKIHVSVKNGPRAMADIVQALIGENGNNASTSRIEVNAIEMKKPSLNDVFLYYTGREFRDEEASLADRLKMVGRKGRRGMFRRR